MGSAETSVTKPPVPSQPPNTIDVFGTGELKHGYACIVGNDGRVRYAVAENIGPQRFAYRGRYTLFVCVVPART